MEFRAEVTTRMIHDPRRGFAATAGVVETRWDPLTGQTARLLRDVDPLLPTTDFDVAELAARTRPSCPFCPDRIEAATPRFVGASFGDGRLRVGRAVLFPNLLPYAAYSSVCVYAADRHHLPLAEMTPVLAADNLRAQVAFVGAAYRDNPAAATWASINGNHLLPAGSSVFHPHTQGGCHPVPTNAQAQLLAVPDDRAEEYLRWERRAGQRHIATTGRIDWVAAFAPAGPGEIRGFSRGVGGLAELGDDVVVELAAGITATMHTYAALGISSCNLAVYGAPPQATGCRLLVRLVCRSPLAPFYRSDVTYLERLHAEAATDISPEDLAAQARRHFPAGPGGTS
jgi:UDPglucose--hexose-1-phosphate uridylyltransferase